MSPTVFKWKGYRFHFFSREELRRHVHVICADGEAKFWLDPEIALAKNYHLSVEQLSEIETVIRERKNELIKIWDSYFSGRSH